MASSRSRSLRRLARVAVLAGAGAAAWEWQRRRDLHAINSDPEWAELNRGLEGRPQVVRSSDGTALHVEQFGPDDAPTIVLVHGWTCDLTFWHYQIRDLSRFFRVVAYDQRGHGSSDIPQDESCYTADTLAADLQAILDATLRDGERCLIAGHSMGGMTIVSWAGRHPQDVQRRLASAVLVNTGMNELVARILILGPTVGRRMQQTLYPLVTASRPFSTRLEPIAYRVIRRIVAMPDTSPGRVAFLHRMILNCPAPVRAGFGKLFTDLDLSGSVPDLTVPATVIAGEGDRLLPGWHSEQLAARLPHVVEHVTLSGVGHMAPVEAPNAVTSRIRQLAAETLAPERSPAIAG